MINYKKIILGVIFTCITFIAPFLYAENKFEAMQKNVDVPDSIFMNQSRLDKISNYRGKVVLLNLWATWCLPCVQEMPALEKLASQYSEADFRIIALSQDKGGLSVIQNFYKVNKINKLGIYYEQDSKLSNFLSVRGLPSSYLISRKGQIVARLEGSSSWDTENIKKVISNEIEKKY